MQKRRYGKYALIFLAVALSVTVLFYAGRFFVYYQIKKTIEKELANLKNQEIFVSYDHMEVYPWSGKIEFLQLLVKVRKDSLQQGLDAAVPYVLVKGVDIVPFIRSRTLALKHVSAHNPRIVYVQNSNLFASDTTARRKIEFRNISIDDVEFPGIDVYLKSENGTDTLLHMLGDLSMAGLALSKQGDSLRWDEGHVRMNNFAMRLHQQHYGTSFKKLAFTISEESLTLDSLLIKPVLGRSAFMETFGRQQTYMEAAIPHAAITGIDWTTYPSPALDIHSIALSLSIKMFRDKRYPFIPDGERHLPVQLLRKLPFLLTIDSVLIEDSFVSYEEFPEKGDSTGRVYFDRLRSTITSVHNNPEISSPVRMVSTAAFMGAGDLEASFMFPTDTTKASTVKGTLRNLPMVRLNNMVGSAAKAKFESGTMTNLIFDFRYTPVKSTGRIELNYNDLKVLSLRENSRNEQAVSTIKTLLLNTFIIKKDMDEDVSKDRRSGTIDYQRDRHRSVFNYWWKSIFSGIKSAYRLDKLPVDISNADEEKENEKSDNKGIWSKIF